MIFCEHCFEDREIINIIRNVSQTEIEICPVCHRKKGSKYDTDCQNDLTPYFEDLLRIYVPSRMLPEGYPRDKECTLADDIKKRWNIFNDIPTRDIQEILKSVCNDTFESSPELFEDVVGIPELYDSTYLDKCALVRNHNWDAFVEEIKIKNRYHSKLINFDFLVRYCSFMRMSYKSGHVFYRARISGEEGFYPSQMSAPPVGKSSEGRANARGITCLYLASNKKTTIHEVRAAAFDFVSIGTFKLKKDVIVVDLRKITEISPFLEGIDILEYAVNKQYLEKLNSEMSKALRKDDENILDYVPTQYIVDFIKSIEHNGKPEYDGIVYNSTMNAKGYNLAIFDPTLFECKTVEVNRIERLQYKTEKIKRNDD